MFTGRGRGAKSLADYARIVEGSLHELGVDPSASNMTVDRGYGWRFKRGSAIIEVYTADQEGRGYLQVLSPIMHLPATGLLPLYRRLLEYNMQLTNAALGVYQDVVYVFSERPLQDLDSSEASTIITMVAGYADDLDNALVNEYGGRLYSQI